MSYPFSAGQVLTAADLNAYAGLVLVKTQTVSAGVSSVTVTNAFSATFDNYFVTLMSGASSADGEVRMKIGSASTGYYSKIAYLPWGSTTWAFATDSNAAQFSNVGSARTTGISLAARVFMPYVATRTVYESTYIGPKTNSVLGMSGGFLDNAGQYTDVTFTLSTGTFLYSPVIRVYGYNNG